MIKLYNKIFLICLGIFALNIAIAKNNNTKQLKQNHYSNLAMDCAPANSSTALEINNAKVYLGTGGEIFYRAALTDAGYEIPKGSGIYSIFAGALWIGALDDDGNLKLAAQTYRTNGEDFWPGPLDDNGQTNNFTCSNFDKFWSVAKSEIDAFNADFADGSIDNAIPVSISTWKGPFVDADGDNIYNPTNGDYPKIDGELATWYVINDKGNDHGATGGDAIGIQIETLVYGFNTDDLDDVTFMNYTLINKSSENLRKAYLGTWLDPDLGNFGDDFVGCDTLRSLGICYNGDGDDETTMQGAGYGENPPFIALQILDGILNSNGEELGMSAFVFYNNAGVIGNPNDPQTDPQTAQEHYNYLTGRWRDGVPITYGGTGYNEDSTDEVPYMFPNDPSNADGWSECAAGNTPSDRRFVMSTGPFDLLPGVSKKMKQAVLWKRQAGAFDNGCPSFASIQQMADNVLEFYDLNLAEDNIPPVITIDSCEVCMSGCEPCDVQLGTNPFIAPTAFAIDNIDGQVEVTIDDSNVDTNANGIYIISYTATDNNNNTIVKELEVVVGNGLNVNSYNATTISMYPNPANNFVTLDLQGNNATNINIYSIGGQLVLSDVLNNNNSKKLDIIKLNKGVYLYEVLNNNEIIHLSKLVVN